MTISFTLYLFTLFCLNIVFGAQRQSTEDSGRFLGKRKDSIEEPGYDVVEEQECIPELEAVLQDDGAYIYEESKSCPPTSADYNTESVIQGDQPDEPEIDDVEKQTCIPELEAVLQDDGTYLYEESKSCPSTSIQPVDYQRESELAEENNVGRKKATTKSTSQKKHHPRRKF